MLEEECVVEEGLTLRIVFSPAKGDVDYVVIEILPYLLHVLVLLKYSKGETLLIIGAGITILPIKLGIREFTVIIIEEKLVVA